MATDRIVSLMAAIESDPWRTKVGFSCELQDALNACLEANDVREITKILNKWISDHQPCLFGRIAAKQSAITYCLITEAMLVGSEDDLHKHIQAERLKWISAGFKGQSSSFIIAVLSAKLASALPNDIVKRIAARLGYLYLQEPVVPDRIYLDHLYLEQPDESRSTWEWPVGVNYFSAQGDGRWWQDHRFPAAIAFSMNSVGHMVKSGKLKHAWHEFENLMGTADGAYKAPTIDSLDKALGLAMRTIQLASDTVSGRATFLLPEPEREPGRAECPAGLPRTVLGMDCEGYRGFYHTDYTIPSEYFEPDVLRPALMEPKALDFTYLFRKSLDNPDFYRMGEGRRIRESGETAQTGLPHESYPFAKRLRAVPVEVRVADVPLLVQALGSHPL
jgi:hypothetical protein